MLIFYITLVVNSGFLGFIVVKKWKELTHPLYLSFVLSIFCLLLWTIFDHLADNTMSHKYALLYTQATIPAAFLMCWFLFIFSCLFLLKLSSYRRVSKIYLGTLVLFSILAMMGLVIEDVTVDPAVGISSVTNSPLFIGVILLYILLFGHAFYNLYTKLKILTGTQREQIRYVLLGWVLFLSGGIVVSGIIPLLWNNATISKIGPLFSICMVGLTTYAIVKHHFLDIRIIIQRGLIYLIVLGTLVVIYATSLELIGHLFHLLTNTTLLVSAGGTMIIGVVFFRPVELYFQKISDPLFFKDRYQYSEALHQLCNVLYENISEKDIIAESTKLLKTIFKTPYVVIRFQEELTPLVSALPETLSIPIITNNTHTGVIELGPKYSGDTYSKEDKKLLQTFSLQAAIALEKGRLYEKVETYNIHLEQLVYERTKEIKDVQEEQKQTMIDISHNLQTPLAVIIGELELLEKAHIEKEKINGIRKSVDRVSGFIRQLLRLAWFDHSMYTIESSVIHISELMNEQLEYYEVMANEQDISVISDIAQDVYILGNKRLLAELFTNIVANAIKSRAPNRENKIYIAVTATHNAVTVSITDNGIGIKESELPHLFTRYYKNSSDIHTSTGTGLGLAICKKIAEKHNGTITCTSIFGYETSFSVTLPRYTQ